MPSPPDGDGDAPATEPVDASATQAPGMVGDATEQARRVATPTALELGSSFVPPPDAAPLAGLPDPVCAGGTDVDDLIRFFDGHAPVLGADYQRAYPLPDGRVLWLFQDAFVATSHGRALVHNIGLLQSGGCFQLLRDGTTEHPRPYLLADLTVPFERWFWALGGDIGADGLLHVFVAEMRERGSGYLDRTEPVATWLVDIDPRDLRVVGARPAPDDSSALYGWAVVSDDEFSYLFAQCHRQFGWDPLWFAPEVLAHDLGCSADVYVARVARGRLATSPRYWNGLDWVADPSAAAPVIPRDGRSINPTQIARWDGRFVAVTKVDDWWGDSIVLDVADEAGGPWTTYATISVTPECDSCNTYFASIVPFGAGDGTFVVGVSCNVWNGEYTAHYNPTFLDVPAPSR
jgi:hypothetical protein